MATWYLDFVAGNDANNGTSWAQAKKTINGLNALGVAGGDTVKVAKTASPVALAVQTQLTTSATTNPTFTSISGIQTIINAFAAGARWTAYNSATVSTSTTSSLSYYLSPTSSPGGAYGTVVFPASVVANTKYARWDLLSAQDFSAYRHFAIWLNHTALSALWNDTSLRICLCSDDIGNTIVHDFAVTRDRIFLTSDYTGQKSFLFRVDNGAPLSSSIRSIAIYSGSSPANLNSETIALGHCAIYADNAELIPGDILMAEATPTADALGRTCGVGMVYTNVSPVRIGRLGIGSFASPTTAPITMYRLRPHLIPLSEMVRTAGHALESTRIAFGDATGATEVFFDCGYNPGTDLVDGYTTLGFDHRQIQTLIDFPLDLAANATPKYRWRRLALLCAKQLHGPYGANAAYPGLRYEDCVFASCGTNNTTAEIAAWHGNTQTIRFEQGCRLGGIEYLIAQLPSGRTHRLTEFFDSYLAPVSWYTGVASNRVDMRVGDKIYLNDSYWVDGEIRQAFATNYFDNLTERNVIGADVGYLAHWISCRVAFDAAAAANRNPNRLLFTRIRARLTASSGYVLGCTHADFEDVVSDNLSVTIDGASTGTLPGVEGAKATYLNMTVGSVGSTFIVQSARVENVDYYMPNGVASQVMEFDSAELETFTFNNEDNNSLQLRFNGPVVLRNGTISGFLDWATTTGSTDIPMDLFLDGVDMSAASFVTFFTATGSGGRISNFNSRNTLFPAGFDIEDQYLIRKPAQHRALSWHHNLQRIPNNHVAQFQGGSWRTETTEVHTVGGIGWRLRTRPNWWVNEGDCLFPIGSMAVLGGASHTVSVWVKSMHADVKLRLVCPGRQLTETDLTTQSAPNATTGAWEQLSFTLTPSASGVLDFYVIAYFPAMGSVAYAYVDDFLVVLT